MNRNSSLGIHPREVKIYIHTKTFSYFFAALFTVPQNGQQPAHCQLVETREGYSSMKRKNCSYLISWMDLRNIILSERTHS